MALIIGTPVNGAAITFTLAAGNHFLLQQGIVIHTTSVAVDSGNGGHSISIYGTIIGNQPIIMGDNDTDFGNRLVIGTTGSVSSPNASNDVVEVNGGQSTVINYGLIAGGYGVDFSSDLGSGSSITNYGMIVTSQWSVYAFGNERVTLVNLGTITSYDSLSFRGNDGKDAVTNKGTMTGGIDFLSNDDTYNGTGGRVNGTVYGNLGNDTLIGGSFSDKLDGGLNNDLIWGRGGNDLLTGGLGLDRFYFDTAPNTLTNRDRISDFYAVEDTIFLKKTIFGAITQAPGFLQGQFYWESATGVAHDPTDRIILNTLNGVLSYDSNGNAAGGVQQIAVLVMVANTPSNADFFVY